MAWWSEYLLFLAQWGTLLAVVLVMLGKVLGAKQAPTEGKGRWVLEDLSAKHMAAQQGLQLQLAAAKEAKALRKTFKKIQKANVQQASKPRLFVMDFKGGVEAKEVNTLREEVSMILDLATPEDRVLLRLESGGGVVHGYGLGAAQLERLKTAGIPLTVAVDKIAASGGYMMACVADEIIAAPFAIVGSIGVIGQLPNVNRWLKKHAIDYEQHTAGEFKRTLTVLGENTPEAREKFKADLAQIHQSFNAFVGSHRPHMDLTKVTTGEHWLADYALSLGLVDRLQTSDDYVHAALARHQVVLLRFQPKVSMASYLTQQGVQGMLNGLISRMQSLCPWIS